AQGHRPVDRRQGPGRRLADGQGRHRGRGRPGPGGDLPGRRAHRQLRGRGRPGAGLPAGGDRHPPPRRPLRGDVGGALRARRPLLRLPLRPRRAAGAPAGADAGPPPAVVGATGPPGRAGRRDPRRPRCRLPRRRLPRHRPHPDDHLRGRRLRHRRRPRPGDGARDRAHRHRRRPRARGHRGSQGPAPRAARGRRRWLPPRCDRCARPVPRLADRQPDGGSRLLDGAGAPDRHRGRRGDAARLPGLRSERARHGCGARRRHVRAVPAGRRPRRPGLAHPLPAPAARPPPHPGDRPPPPREQALRRPPRERGSCGSRRPSGPAGGLRLPAVALHRPGVAVPERVPARRARLQRRRDRSVHHPHQHAGWDRHRHRRSPGRRAGPADRRCGRAHRRRRRHRPDVPERGTRHLRVVRRRRHRGSGHGPGPRRLRPGAVPDLAPGAGQRGDRAVRGPRRQRRPARRRHPVRPLRRTRPRPLRARRRAGRGRRPRPRRLPGDGPPGARGHQPRGRAPRHPSPPPHL
ncbi:MAG: hypothetical protein AVDCRST_MAG20-178, partial [uncultured Acidimicrobiales bacterium]